ncbi:MAG: HEAT repeat domain-containing protein [Acidobacteriota bacterium]
MPEENSSPDTAPPGEGSGTDDQRLTPGRIVSRFLLVPILVTIVCVAVFLMFGLLSNEPADPYDYLREIKQHSGGRRWEAALGLSRMIENPRWQAAFGLSQQVARDPLALGQDETLVREIVSIFEEARENDPRTRQYLALVMGRLGNRIASEALLSALSDEDSETQIHSMWALGALDEPQAVQPITVLLGHHDAGVRKMATYTLGALGQIEAADALVRALGDPVPDVSWNAAIALSRLGDSRGIPMLLRLLESEFLGSIEVMSEQQKEDVTVEAIRALASLREVSVRPILEAIRNSDRSLKIRQAAIEALAAYEAS